MSHCRRFVLAAGACALAIPLVAKAQPARNTRRIGILALGYASATLRDQRFFSGLLERLGYEVGRNLVIERRYAEGETARLDRLADELVQLRVELIVAIGNDPLAAAQRATRTIPIVMFNVAAPVELGFVASLAQPGGNITGTSSLSPETSNKVLQVLKEAAPQAARVAILSNPRAPGASLYRAENRRASGAIGLEVQVFDMERPEDVTPALQRIVQQRADALYAALDPVVASRLAEVADFALRHKLPSIATVRPFVEAGGALCYGPDYALLAERSASFVDRILKGARPADLPVEQPTKINLLINLRTAQAIGLVLPQSLLLRADEVLQ
jgi:putative tryptophan/tyrosine transport system substrate-binding protein